MKYIASILKFVFWVVLCQLPGLAGAWTVQPNLEWYHSLVMPPFAPPDAAFGIAWTILYILLGISAFLVFQKGLANAKKVLFLFIIQLALNAWWTPVFFGNHNPGAALVILGIMLAEGIWLARAIYARHRTAAWLMAPYGIWLLYAGYLNAGVWLLN